MLNRFYNALLLLIFYSLPTRCGITAFGSSISVKFNASTDFKKEFLTMKFADDDLEIAKKNVSRESILAMSANLGRDGREMQSYSFQNNHTSLVNKNMNQRMSNPLLNPFAWGALMQQIMQGDKSRAAD